MALDPSVILSGQPVQMQNPLTLASQVYSLKNASQENQINQMKLSLAKQDYDDNQAVRQAYKDNLQTNPDGSQSINRAGVLSQLNQTNPMLAAKANAGFQEMDLAQMQRQHQIAQDLMFSIHDQASLDAAREKAESLGLPTNNMPDQFDQGLIDKAKVATLDAGDQIKLKQQQLTNQIAQQNANSESLKARAAAVDAGLGDPGQGFSLRNGGASSGGKPPASLVANNGAGIPGQAQTTGPMAPGYNPPPKMRVEQMSKLSTEIAGSRMQQDAQQEVKNTLAADNINEIIKQAPGGNLNKLNNQQTKLAMMELVKMAGGSVPTEGELETMTPNGIAQKYGGLLQNLTNKSQPANAGEFLRQGIDYANGIAAVSKQRLAARENDIVDRYREGIGEANYNKVKAQIANRYGVSADSASTKSNPNKQVMSFDEWKAQQANK